jgi:hypothetical protein
MASFSVAFSVSLPTTKDAVKINGIHPSIDGFFGCFKSLFHFNNANQKKGVKKEFQVELASTAVPLLEVSFFSPLSAS